MGTNVSGGAARRPFSSWRTPYREGNSSLGYFADLVVEARHESPTVYLKEIGLNGRNIDPRQVLSSLLRLPLKSVDRDALDRASAFVTMNGVTLAGQELRRRQWSITQRRWCPACLAESPHHRTWWDVLPYATCHLHGCPIEDADQDGLPVEWWWPNMAESPRGHRLAHAAPRLPDSLVTLSSYLVGRLGFANPIPIPLLDRAPLGDAVDFVRLVGRMLGSPPTSGVPPKDAPTKAEEVVALCSGDGARLVERTKDWLVSHSEDGRRLSGLRCFGWAALHGRSLRDGKLKGWMFDVMRASLGAVGHVGKKRGVALPGSPAARAPVPKGGIGLHDLAARLGHHHRGVLNVANRIGVMPERSWYRGRLAFGPAAVDAILSAFGSLATHTEAARTLGLKPAAFGRLVSEGTVKPLLDVSRGQASGRRYLRGDIDALRLEIVTGRIVLPDALGQRPRRVPVARLWQDGAAPGGGPLPVGMCQVEVEVELGVSAETLVALEGLGHLRRLPNTAVRGVDLIDRASVVAIGKRLASVRVYRGIVAATAAQVVERLAGYGLRPVVVPVPGGRVTPMFERAAVQRALGLERDPDARGNDRVGELWLELRRHLLVECPRLKCPDRMPADRFTVYTGNRKVMFHVQVDRTASSILVCVRISKAWSTRRWGFFEANRAEIISVSPKVRWDERPHGVEGTVTVADGGDVADAAVAIERLTRLLGGTASGPAR